MIDHAKLLKRAAQAAEQAYCPYSDFRVGAAVLGASGAIFTGANVENASFGLTVCAERVAIQSAVAAGERDFRALAVVVGGDKISTPCGACRQVLAEFVVPDTPIYMARIDDLSTVEETTIAVLLPKAFKLG